MLLSGTVLELAPMRFSVLVVPLVLGLLFTMIEPEVSADMDFLMRLAFWCCNTGIGMLGILLASYCLASHRWSALPLVVSLGVTGVIGCLLASPFFYLVCNLFPLDEPNDWLDQFASRGWMQGILVEFLEVLPILLTSWYAINIPFLFRKRSEAPARSPERVEPAIDLTVADKASENERLKDLYSRLPEVLGKELVAISSDLHYLNVYTTRGKALVLGSLKYYVDALGVEGIQVHRSSWVAKAHVVKVFISGGEAWCLMTNGLKIPVSRSKRKEVKAYFGQVVRAELAIEDVSLV